MIRLELFKPKSVFQQTKEVITNILEGSKTTPPILTLSGEKEEEIPFRERMQVYGTTRTYLLNRKFNECQFGVRWGKPKGEYAFHELLFTLGFKNDAGSCHFTRDALGKIICYNLYIVKTLQYVEDKRADRQVTKGVIDPYSFIPISLEEVKAKFSTHSIYQEFMDQLGKTAVR